MATVALPILVYSIVMGIISSVCVGSVLVIRLVKSRRKKRIISKNPIFRPQPQQQPLQTIALQASPSKHAAIMEEQENNDSQVLFYSSEESQKEENKKLLKPASKGGGNRGGEKLGEASGSAVADSKPSSLADFPSHCINNLLLANEIMILGFTFEAIFDTAELVAYGTTPAHTPELYDRIHVVLSSLRASFFLSSGFWSLFIAVSILITLFHANRSAFSRNRSPMGTFFCYKVGFHLISWIFPVTIQFLYALIWL